MQVIKTTKGTFYREKIYLDGRAIHSPRFKRKSDAQNWKARLLSERGKYQASGVLPKIFEEEVIEKVSLADYANMWLNLRVKTQLSRRTYEHYTNNVKRHILPRFGKLDLREIKLTHADQLILELTKRGHNQHGINLIIGVFKRIMIEAVREGRLEKNPFQYLKELKEPPRPDVFLTSDEIERVLEVSKGHYFHTLFLLAVNTGMRRGELAGLCWDKISFDLNLIEISRLCDRAGLEDQTKTAKSRRFVPMNVVVRNYLLKMKEQSSTEVVIVDSRHRPFNVDHLYRELRHWLKRAEINRELRFHDLRHTFASHFTMNGGNIYDLQKIMGHTSLEMTQRYAHLAPEHLIEASNVVSFGAKKLKREEEILKVAPI